MVTRENECQISQNYILHMEFYKDLQWNSKSQLMESDAPELSGMVIVKMGREEGGFQALLTQLPLLIVCHELIIWRLTIYGSAMVWNVGAVCHVKPSR